MTKIDKCCVYCGKELHYLRDKMDGPLANSEQEDFRSLITKGTERVNNSDLPVLFGGVCCDCMKTLTFREGAKVHSLTMPAFACGFDFGHHGEPILTRIMEEAASGHGQVNLHHVNCRSARLPISTPGPGDLRSNLLRRNENSIAGLRCSESFVDEYFSMLPRFNESMQPIEIVPSMTPEEVQRARRFNEQLRAYRRLVEE